MGTNVSKKTNLGWRRVLRATGFSLQGLRRVWRDEEAFRMEVWLGLFLLLPVILIQLGSLERLALVSVWLLVLIVEILNSAIEAVVDQIGTEWQDLSGKAKDLGSLAVMVALILAALVWLVILVPKILFI